MDVEENLNAGLSRSGFLTYFTREAVRSALNVSFYFILFFIVLFFFNFSFQYPEPSRHRYRPGNVALRDSVCTLWNLLQRS
jgi:hypothetical protein